MMRNKQFISAAALCALFTLSALYDICALMTLYKLDDSTYENAVDEQLQTSDAGLADSHHHEQKPLHHEVSSSKNDIVTYDFPYPLTCEMKESSSSSHPEDYSITLAYHIGMVGTWDRIVSDQLQTITKCGLGQHVDNSIISYSGGNLEDFLNLAENQSASFITQKPKIVESVEVPWEGDIMNKIHDHCSSQTKPTIVFYLHNKGSSRYTEDWKESVKNGRTWTYGHTLYWRKYLEYFTIERPELCIEQIRNGYSACGVHLQQRPSSHFSGNFWVASCDYIRTLKPLDWDELREMDEGKRYTSAEMWIGSKFNDTNAITLKNLEHPNFYMRLAMPEEYWFEMPPSPPLIFNSSNIQD